ncbi:MAG: GAF domain-containing protein [Solirubrobacterales bacterium]
MSDPAGLSPTTAGSSLDEPKVIYAKVLESLVTQFEAVDGRIHRIDLKKGCYVSTGSLRNLKATVSWNARSLSSDPKVPVFERAAATRSPVLDKADEAWSVALPVIRDQTVVAVVELLGARRLLSTDANRMMRVSRGQLQQIADAYEADFVHRVLEQTAQFKVNLFEDEPTTMGNLMDFVAKSCGMQYVALRRLATDDSLVSVESRGFDDVKKKKLNFLNFSSDYVPFAWVVAEREHWIARNLKGDEYKAIRERSELQDVRSFVACPVLIGNQMWGVLSFAAGVEYDYADLEVYALRVLANLTGVALEAAGKADTAAGDAFNDGRLMQAVLSNEVVVATRHELDQWLEVLGVTRSTFLNLLEEIENGNRSSRLSKKEVASLKAGSENLDAAHSQMNRIMGTVRVSQRDLIEERNPVNVLNVWERVKDSFNFRINRARVSRVVKDVPERLLVLGSEDALRIALMQLVINSLDAFDRGFSTGRREIGLRLENRSGGMARLRYYDTAGGIIPGTLLRQGKRFEEERQMDMGELVFERYVSSKEKGTGLGLASCRAALSIMNGSIELKDWRRGITFDITLHEWQA